MSTGLGFAGPAATCFMRRIASVAPATARPAAIAAVAIAATAAPTSPRPTAVVLTGPGSSVNTFNAAVICVMNGFNTGSNSSPISVFKSLSAAVNCCSSVGAGGFSFDSSFIASKTT